MAGLPAGRNPWFTETQRISKKLSMSSLGAWFHQPLHVSWRNQFRLHEWLLSQRTLDLPQVTSHDYGFAQEQGNPIWEVLLPKRMMATYYPEYQQEPLIKVQFARTKLLTGSQDHWESGQSGSGWDQPLSWKRWKSWGKPQVISYMRQIPDWMRKEKTASSLMAGSGAHEKRTHFAVPSCHGMISLNN